jgi:hypothetical protein
MNSKHVRGRLIALLLVAGLLALAGQVRASGLEDARRRGKLLAGVKTDSPPFGYLDSAGVIQGFDVKERGQGLTWDILALISRIVCRDDLSLLSCPENLSCTFATAEYVIFPKSSPISRLVNPVCFLMR